VTSLPQCSSRSENASRLKVSRKLITKNVQNGLNIYNQTILDADE